jgi:hypothetical protein
MRFTNVSGAPANWTMGFRRDGRELLVVMAKVTYVLPLSGQEASPAPEQVPLVQADVFTGQPGLSSPLYESDYAHSKPGCDVLLIGSAYAPRAQEATRVVVGIKVGSVAKTFAVVGPRVWQKGPLGITPSTPRAFQSLPITYDCAFGGTDRTHQDRGQTRTFVSNPVGAGYYHYTDDIDGKPMPNTEQVDRPVTEPNGKYLPMALSPIGRNWAPRSGFAGTYDKDWIENTAPLWPADFDERYFQAAPQDQIVPHPQGGEPVVLGKLTPDGYRAFQLPVRRMPVTFIPHKGRDATRQGVLDTIVFEPDREIFTLTWRVTLPLGKSVFDVKETVVGEMPAAWHRARRSPGKPYYRSLGEAVAAIRKTRNGR